MHTLCDQPYRRGRAGPNRRPGLSSTAAEWLRPNEFDHALQPLRQVVVFHTGLPVGETWDLGALAEDCAAVK